MRISHIPKTHEWPIENQFSSWPVNNFAKCYLDRFVGGGLSYSRCDIIKAAKATDKEHNKNSPCGFPEQLGSCFKSEAYKYYTYSYSFLLCTQTLHSHNIEGT